MALLMTFPLGPVSLVSLLSLARTVIDICLNMWWKYNYEKMESLLLERKYFMPSQAQILYQSNMEGFLISKGLEQVSLFLEVTV